VEKKSRPDHEIFDASDVTPQVLPSKRRNQVDIRLSSKTEMNLLKILAGLEMLSAQIRHELEIMDADEREH
jgi:hypothetical protein